MALQRAQFGRRGFAVFLAQLAPHADGDVAQADRFVVVGSQIGRMQGRVANAAAGEHHTAAEGRGVHFGMARRAWRQQPVPEPGPGLGIGTGELHHHLEAAGEGAIDLLAQVGGENAGSPVALDARQQMTHFHVGVAIPRFLHFPPAREQGIGLVELQHGFAIVQAVEQGVEVLFGLADVLAHEPAEIDPVEGPAQFGRQHARRQGLAGARGAGEQGHRTAEGGSAPFVLHPHTMADPQQVFVQHGDAIRRQDQIVPVRLDGHGHGPDGRRRRRVHPLQARGEPRRRPQGLIGIGVRLAQQPVSLQGAGIGKGTLQMRGLVRFQGQQFLNQGAAGPRLAAAGLQALVRPADPRLDLRRHDAHQGIEFHRRQGRRQQALPGSVDETQPFHPALQFAQLLEMFRRQRLAFATACETEGQQLQAFPFRLQRHRRNVQRRAAHGEGSVSVTSSGLLRTVRSLPSAARV